jgi:hypothetical protein
MYGEKDFFKTKIRIFKVAKKGDLKSLPAKTKTINLKQNQCLVRLL